MPTTQQPVSNTTPAPQPAVTQPPTVPAQPPADEYRDLPPRIADTKIDYQKTVYVKKAEVTIYPYDNDKEDGDIVSININGVWVRENYEIKHRRDPPPQRVSSGATFSPVNRTTSSRRPLISVPLNPIP